MSARLSTWQHVGNGPNQRPRGSRRLTQRRTFSLSLLCIYIHTRGAQENLAHPFRTHANTIIRKNMTATTNRQAGTKQPIETRKLEHKKDTSTPHRTPQDLSRRTMLNYAQQGGPNFAMNTSLHPEKTQKKNSLQTSTAHGLVNALVNDKSSGCFLREINFFCFGVYGLNSLVG